MGKMQTIHTQQIQECKNKIEELNEITVEHTIQIQEIRNKIDTVQTQSGPSQTKVTYIYQNVEELTQQSKFSGEGGENPIEFRKQCERSMEAVGNNFTDSEKINWVARLLQGSAREWYSVIRDQVSSYAEFMERFEARYWNEQVQRRVRQKLEFGRYHPTRLTKEQYVIRLLAESKHLRPELTEMDVINKLAHHFEHDIKVALITRGISRIDELLIFLAQWDEVTRSSYTPTPTYTKPNNNNSNKNANENNKKTTYYNRNKPVKMSAISNTENESVSKNVTDGTEGDRA
jgi:hypothetical protein